MIGVIVPAHNEEDYIGACLASVVVASACARLACEPVFIVVALDSCTDGTSRIVREMGIAAVTTASRNVGEARAAGAELAIDAGARWLAFTDADSVVSAEWLWAQLEERADAVCGTVEVRNWGTYGDRMREHYDATYNDRDGHSHIHGANLGVDTAAYRKVGGFRPLASSEDVALVESLRHAGASIAWSARPRVVTSARRHFRAPGGFGETLARIDRTASWQRAAA